jgi:hypothetical protein
MLLSVSSSRASSRAFRNVGWERRPSSATTLRIDDELIRYEDVADDGFIVQSDAIHEPHQAGATITNFAKAYVNLPGQHEYYLRDPAGPL